MKLVSMWDLMQSLGPLYQAIGDLEAIRRDWECKDAAATKLEVVDETRWADDGGAVE